MSGEDAAETIREAVELLRRARQLLTSAGATHAKRQVVRAIDSASGAARHAAERDAKRRRRMGMLH
jgi:hypothetical protein